MENIILHSKHQSDCSGVKGKFFFLNDFLDIDITMCYKYLDIGN